jgi:LysM repeat protein
MAILPPATNSRRDNFVNSPFYLAMKTVMTRLLLFVLALVVPAQLRLHAQPAERKHTPQDYVDKYKEDAVREMQLYKVPASITLAQGMLESDNGNSALAVYANNHFGIKCHKEWSGETYVQDDDDTNECFRKYPSVYDSYADHSQFLKTRQRYAFLFELKVTDYKGWARGLKQAGYATDPKYADRLIEIIERYKLNEYDKEDGLPVLVAGGSKTDGNQTVVSTIHRREVYKNNNVKYVIVKPGDSFMKIAQELEMGVWQLYKYNELQKGAKLAAGQVLYIQPKRKKAEEKTHTVKAGDTMYSISQQYGVKVKYLYKMNNLPLGSQPKVGDVIVLRKS